MIRNGPGHSLYRLKICCVQRAIFTLIDNILKILASLKELLMNQMELVYTLVANLSICALVVNLRVLKAVKWFR